MDTTLLLAQLVNGLQLGLLLFLIAAGLTLVFGIMDLVNLAHGSFYMLGAFIGATVAAWTGSLLLGVLIALPAVAAIALLVEAGIVSRLYKRGHLDQVLATFGLILCFDAATLYLFGPAGLSINLPDPLRALIVVGPVELPAWRLVIILAGLGAAALLWLLITRTRVGMQIRAGASDRVMAEALGIRVRLIFSLVFALGAALAGLAGVLITPITEASVGMGNQVIITAFVVIIIDGIGSVAGSFVAAIVVGLVDTLGRAFLDDILATVVSPVAAETAGPAVASMLIYLLMAVILALRPAGLFPPVSR